MVFNMADIPRGGYDPNLVVAAAQTPLVEFKAGYARMIDAFTEAWSINPMAIGAAITEMYSIGTYAQDLLAVNVPGSSETYGPDFKI